MVKNNRKGVINDNKNLHRTQQQARLLPNKLFNEMAFQDNVKDIWPFSPLSAQKSPDCKGRELHIHEDQLLPFCVNIS